MIYMLIAFLSLAGLVYSYRAFDKRWISPPSLFCLSIGVSAICSLLGQATWNYQEASMRLMVIVSVGLIGFIIGALLSQYKHAFVITKGEINRTDLDELCEYIPLQILVMILGILIFGVIVRMSEVYSLGQDVDGGYFVKAAAVREATNRAFSNVDNAGLVSFSVLERLFERVETIAGYLFTALFVWGSKRKVGKKRLVIIGACAVIPSIFELSGGSRGGVIGYCIGGVIALAIFIILNEERTTSAINPKKLAVFAALLLLGIFLFYCGSYVLTRSIEGGLIDYLSFYFGAGFPSFESMLDGDAVISNFLPGQRAFAGIYSIAASLGVNMPEAYGNPFIWFGSHGSNVYTCFEPSYSDFGLAGEFIVLLLSGYIYTTLYFWTLKKGSAFSVVTYIWIAAPLCDVGRAESLFSYYLFTKSSVLTLVITWIVLMLLKTTLKRHVASEEQ